MVRVAQDTMQAVAIDRFGGIETLSPRTLPVPEVGPNEVLVRVEAAGVGVWDPYEREGGFAKLFGTTPTFPYVLGSDGAGTIVAVGDQATEFREGERVYFFSLANPKGGSYAEFVVLSADNVSVIPPNLSTEQAGAMPVCAMTALRGLDDLDLERGQSLMVVGASGGVGHLAVQLAKRLGARVLAVASGKDGVDLCRRLGADAVADGKKDDVLQIVREFSPDGLDAALLFAGGDPVERALSAVRSGGRVAYPNGVEPEPKERANISVQSFDGMPDPEAIERLNQLIEAGPFEVHVARTFALREAASAQRALEGHFIGKFILKPEQS